MKINKNDLNNLKQIIKEAVNSIGIENIEGHRENLRKLQIALKPEMDLNKRFRWDLLYSVTYSKRSEVINNIYTYANDIHIDTALKTIVRELGL
jgi:hypothetical protein